VLSQKANLSRVRKIGEGMAKAIHSFDVFDTLVARRSVEARTLLKKLEARAGLANLAAARQNGKRTAKYLLA